MKKLLFILCFLIAGSTGAFSEFYKPAYYAEFRVSQMQFKEDEGLIILNYRLKEKDRLYVESPIANPINFIFRDNVEMVNVNYPEAKKKDKETFIEKDGMIEIFVTGEFATPLIFKITYQGCSEEGFCYIPEEQELRVTDLKRVSKFDVGKVKFKSPKTERLDKTLVERLKDNLKNPIIAIFIVLLAGFLTSLTPCVYPMIPIVISYFGKRGERANIFNNFIGSLMYVFGLSVTYTTLGVIAGITGAAFGSIFQKPYFLVVFSALFFLFSFMMSDYILFPSLNIVKSNNLKQPFLLGLITGLIASPCVGPVIIFLLTLIVTTGKVMYGAFLMFFFALGLGIIFILLGTFSSFITKIPKAGSWMDTVKTIFSFLMIITASYFLRLSLIGFSVPGAHHITVGIALLFIIFFLGFFNVRKWFSTYDKRTNLKYFLMLVVFIFAFSFILKGILHKECKETLKLEQGEQLALFWYDSLDVALLKAIETDKFIFVDFTAEWCPVCKEFEHLAERDRELINGLNNFILVRLDYDRNKAIAENYQVLGLPTFIFLDPYGSVIAKETGFLNVESFKKDLLRIMKKLE